MAAAGKRNDPERQDPAKTAGPIETAGADPRAEAADGSAAGRTARVAASFDLRAKAAHLIGGTITVLEDKDGRPVAVERELCAGDVLDAAIRGDRLIAVTADGRRHDLEAVP